MRIVRQREGLEEAIESCRREALQAFGDSSLLIEKYFDQYTFLVFC
jgi:acetyl/propionyl-CoA carboxylase alpha subunit